MASRIIVFFYVMGKKILFVGDTNRGKSEYLARHFGETYYPEATQGVDVKHITLKTSIAIWDLAGNPRYMALDDAYYINADGAIIFADNQSEVDKYVTKLTNVMPNIKYIVVSNTPECFEFPHLVVNKTETSLIQILSMFKL